MIEFGIAFYNFSAFERSLSQWEKIYGGNAPDHDFFDDPADAYDFIQNIQCGVLIFHTPSKDALPGLVKLLKKVHRLVKQKKLKVFGVNELQDKQVLKIFRKLKVEDYLQQSDLRARTFKFKVDLWQRTMLKSIKKDDQGAAEDAGEKSAKSSGTKVDKKNSHEIVSEKPLEMDADQWILKDEKDCKYILRNWNIKMMGPSPYAGKWEDTGKKDKDYHIWKWSVLEDADEIFQELNGDWYFLGEKPDYLWNEDRWLFKGKALRLFFYGQQEKAMRFYSKEGDLHLPKNSQIALTKEPYILETFEKNIEAAGEEKDDSEEEVEDKEEKESERLEGKGKTDHIEHEDLEGDIAEKEDLGGHYKGDVEAEQRQEEEEKEPEKSGWGSKDDNLKGLLEKEAPDVEPEEDREQELAADSYEDLKGLTEEEKKAAKEEKEKDAKSENIEKYYKNTPEGEIASQEEDDKEQDRKNKTSHLESHYDGSGKDSLVYDEEEEQKERKASKEEYKDYSGKGRDSLEDGASEDDDLRGETEEAASRHDGHYKSKEESGIGYGAKKDGPEWNKDEKEEDPNDDLRGLTAAEKKAKKEQAKKTQNLNPKHQSKEYDEEELDTSLGRELRGTLEDQDDEDENGKPEWSKDGGEHKESRDLEGLLESDKERKDGRPSGEIEEADDSIDGHYRSDKKAEAEKKKNDRKEHENLASQSHDLSGQQEGENEKREGHYRSDQEVQEKEKKEQERHENRSERKKGHYRNPEGLGEDEEDRSPYGGVTDTDDIEGYYKPGSGSSEKDQGGHYDSREQSAGKKKKGTGPEYEFDESNYKKKKAGYSIVDEQYDSEETSGGKEGQSQDDIDNEELLTEARALSDPSNPDNVLNLASAQLEAILYQKKKGEPNSSARAFNVKFDDVFQKELTLVSEPGLVYKDDFEHRVKPIMKYQDKKNEIVLDLKYQECEETTKGEELLIFMVKDYNEEKIEKFLAPQRERQKNIGLFLKLATGSE